MVGAAGPQGPQGLQGAPGPKGADIAWMSFDDVLFDVNKTHLTLAAERRVAELAAFLREHPNYLVELEGYADPRGRDAHNLDLSARRVQTVRDALIAAGVDKDNILTGAYGELAPTCTERNEECWQKVRRVEVKVIPESGETAAASPRMPAAK